MLESDLVAGKWHDRALRWLRMVTVKAQDSAAAQHGGMGGGPQFPQEGYSGFSDMQCTL